MELADILDPERISLEFAASSKKTLLEQAAELLSTGPESAHTRDVFDSLCQRERLGSTGLGHGVAIPHGRVEGQEVVAGALIRLNSGIQFDAPDNEPVDLFFAMAVPARCTDIHLRLLAGIAERFGSKDCRDRLRSAETADAIMKIISEPPAGAEPG